MVKSSKGPTGLFAGAQGYATHPLTGRVIQGGEPVTPSDMRRLRAIVAAEPRFGSDHLFWQRFYNLDQEGREAYLDTFESHYHPKSVKAPLTADQQQKLRALSQRQFGVDVTSLSGRRQFLTQKARVAAHEGYRRFQVRPVGNEYGLFEMVDGRLRRTIMSGAEAACRSRQASLIRNLVTRAANDARSSLRIFFHDTGYGFNDELLGKSMKIGAVNVPGGSTIHTPPILGDRFTVDGKQFVIDHVHKFRGLGPNSPEYSVAAHLLNKSQGAVYSFTVWPDGKLGRSAPSYGIRLKPEDRRKPYAEYPGVLSTTTFSKAFASPEARNAYIQKIGQYFAAARQMGLQAEHAYNFISSREIADQVRPLKQALSNAILYLGREVEWFSGTGLRPPHINQSNSDNEWADHLVGAANRVQEAVDWIDYVIRRQQYLHPIDEKQKQIIANTVPLLKKMRRMIQVALHMVSGAFYSTRTNGKSAKTPTLSPRQKQWLELIASRGGKMPGIDLPGMMRRTGAGPVINQSTTGDFTGLQRMGLIHINPDYYGPRGREVTLTPAGQVAARGSKALGEGLDTAGGYLVPAEHGEKPIELLRDGKSATAKAGAPTPPSGGKVQRQQANVTFDTAKLKADLWYGYTINYDFTTKAEVKRFMGQAQAAGFKLGATAQVLEGHARQEMGIPIGIDWQGTLARSKADMMKIAGRLNSEHPKNVMFKLVDSGTSLPHAKPSMAVYADHMNLGSVAFREHAQALYQLAKRIGSKVRSQNSSDMMPLSAAIRPTGKSVKAMPPLLPGGTGFKGKARASLRRTGGPPEEYIFHWTLEYEQAKEYTFQTAQQMTAFMATAKQAGYRIIRRAQPGEVAGQPADENSALSEDRTVLQARFPMIKERMEYGKGTTFIIEHHHGKGFRGFGMVKPPSGGPVKPTGIMINVKTEAGAKVMQSMAQAAGWQVKWR